MLEKIKKTLFTNLTIIFLSLRKLIKVIDVLDVFGLRTIDGLKDKIKILAKYFDEGKQQLFDAYDKVIAEKIGEFRDDKLIMENIIKLAKDREAELEGKMIGHCRTIVSLNDIIKKRDEKIKTLSEKIKTLEETFLSISKDVKLAKQATKSSIKLVNEKQSMIYDLEKILGEVRFENTERIIKIRKLLKS